MKKVNNSAVTTVATVLMVLTTVALASASGGHAQADPNALFDDFFFRCLNFAIVVGILAYFALKPMKKALADRKENVSKSLDDARALRAEAEARFNEVEAKLKAADADIEAVYASIREEGEQEREKIIANAEAMAAKIRTEAERTAEREIENARYQLRSEVAGLAVSLAEQLIKKNIGPDDHDRLLNEYIKSVGDIH